MVEKNLYALTEADKRRVQSWKDLLRTKSYTQHEQLSKIASECEWDEKERKQAMQEYYLTLA